MWIFRYVGCMRRGHAFLVLKHRGAAYRCCLKCGKVEQPGHIHIARHRGMVAATVESD